MLFRISLHLSLLLALFISSVLSGPTGLRPTLTEIKRYTGVGKTSGRYLVTLKEGASRKSLISQLVSVGKGLPVQTKIDYEWATVCNGFAARLDPVSLALLQTLPGVESIEEDGVVQTTATQTNAPWGLSRLSSRTKLANQDASQLNFEYTYDDSGGAGVDIYIIDTGVQVEHTDFGGRAQWAEKPFFGAYKAKDGNGHGTHVAATAGGTTYGVAKKANIYAIKVISDEGSGDVSDIISALDFVGKKFDASRRPTVVNMSIGGGKHDAFDSAVANLVGKGVHVVVAAGNDNSDATNYSPAGVPAAITVGASTISDAKASFSNFGQVVDVFAPGENVISAWPFQSLPVSLPVPLPIPCLTKSCKTSLSGTSMASPHVAGLVAYLLGLQGNTVDSPAEMETRLKELAASNGGVLTGIPDGTANLLAYNGQ